MAVDSCAGRRFLRLPPETQIAALTAHMRALAAGGPYAPTRARWDATCNAAGLPVVSTIDRRIIKWQNLVAAAELKIETPRDNRLRHTADRAERKINKVGAEIDATRTALAPAVAVAQYRAEWPLAAFDEPRRVEVFEVSGVRIERTWYGLR